MVDKNFKYFAIVAVVIAIIFVICMSSDSSSSSSRKYRSSYSSSPTYGAGGYEMPHEGESFSDYVQRVDPDLYDSMSDRYNSLGG